MVLYNDKLEIVKIEGFTDDYVLSEEEVIEEIEVLVDLAQTERSPPVKN